MGNAVGNMASGIASNVASTVSGGMKKTMEENMKQQQDFMVKSQQMNMERQMCMQQLMMQRQIAMQMARTREMFHWICAFSGTLSLLLVAGSIKTKNPKLLGPLLPLSFGIAYQGDMVYGDKMERIRADAEHILNEDPSLIALPNGPVTFEEVESVRTSK